MKKHEIAASFFSRLGQDQQYIPELIQREMTPELIEMINQFGIHMKLDNMEAERYKSSLMIIGYLLRAHEDAMADSEPGQQGPDDDQEGSKWH